MRFTIAAASIGVALSVIFGVRAEAAPFANALRIVDLAPACAFATDVYATASDSSLTAGDFSAEFDHIAEFDSADGPQTASSSSSTSPTPSVHPAPHPGVPVDANGDPIPIERQEPTRILGFMPNFRTVSGGAKPPAPGWKYNFSVATHQATDYSSFIFLGLTSFMAEGINEHPALGKGASGFYAYTWRGFLDKSDNTYLSAWLLASSLHEDTRFYALGAGHNYFVRELYVISRAGGCEDVRRTPDAEYRGAWRKGHNADRVANLLPVQRDYVSRARREVRLLGDARRDLHVDSRVLSGCGGALHPQAPREDGGKGSGAGRRGAVKIIR